MPPAPPAESETPKEVPEGQPMDLAAEDVTGTSLTLNWNPPKNIGSAGLAGYIVEYCKESNPPKIRLPRNLRGTFIRKVGQSLNLVIPFQGNPKPIVTWTKDDEPLDPARVNIHNSPVDTILFIRKVERKDSGQYKLVVQIDTAMDEVVIEIQVVEKPGPPQNLKMLDVWGFNVTLEWLPPKDKGNTEISGYTIQKADKKTGEWFTVLENAHSIPCTISDLVMGNHYNFRVFSENLCGLSETAVQCKDTAYIPKTSRTTTKVTGEGDSSEGLPASEGAPSHLSEPSISADTHTSVGPSPQLVGVAPGVTYNPPVYQEKDFNEPPKFTQPPADKTATVGFTTKLYCSVRGNPKPKISWLKNQMLLDQNPKFRVLTNEGICTLEIRKPSQFDGGVYTCKAVNALGEAVADCKLDVKAVQVSQ
ncbi:myosin-binding protein H-like isoform X3 [Heptranchias perlo]|uniref:myosin-binding protein H-like isoform X3 n=1 Tax=Heptranchias perlo TaxID=212740 RepID=UPI00355AAD69